MNCLTVKLLPLETKGKLFLGLNVIYYIVYNFIFLLLDSVAQKLYSSLLSWEWKHVVSMRPLTTPSWSAMLISVRICMPTLYCLEVPPCTQELPIECRRKSPLWLHLQWKSRSLLHQKGNTQYGLEDLFWLLYLLSNRCGFLNRSMMNRAHPLCTESAFKYFYIYFPKKTVFFILIFLYFFLNKNQNYIKKKSDALGLHSSKLFTAQSIPLS